MIKIPSTSEPGKQDLIDENKSKSEVIMDSNDLLEPNNQSNLFILILLRNSNCEESK
jgi:hypothetical protein